MSARGLVDAFERWRGSGEPMVLATVYETLGSTYSKAGQRILIAANGDYRGLVSGGCLEGDLAERARGVIESGAPLAVTFDMRDDADDLWGLGVGCNGLIRVFLQRLAAAQAYQPFAAIARRLLRPEPTVVATVIDAPPGSALAPGVTLVWDGDDPGRRDGTDRNSGADANDDSDRSRSDLDRNDDPDPHALRLLAPGCRDTQAAGRAMFRIAEDGAAVLYAPVEPVRRLLVLGAGLDAVPVVGMAAELGWRVTVADHRPAYLEQGDFAAAEHARLVDPAAMGRELEPARFDAVIVMSHHLATDRTYLAQLADVRVGYLGVLGPKERRDRLLAALGETGTALQGRLRGPVGLDIGADDPESIALSLLAEMHAVLAGASGRALSGMS